MTDPGYAEMGEDRVAEFLGTGGTGVVSPSRGADEPPYSLPVSYGYDAATGHFYFRLAAGPNSAKADLLEDGHASFVAFEHTDGGWKSVVAAGDLHEVSEVEVASGSSRSSGASTSRCTTSSRAPPARRRSAFSSSTPTR